MPWNQCTCEAARRATIIGFAKAKEQFPAYQPRAGAEPALPPVNREATVVSSEAAQSRGRTKRGRTARSIRATGAKPIAAGEQPVAMIVEGLTEALAIAKGEAEPYRVATFAACDDDTPLFNPDCPSCIKKRAIETAKSAERVAKWRARQKETT